MISLWITMGNAAQISEGEMERNFGDEVCIKENVEITIKSIILGKSTISYKKSQL